MKPQEVFGAELKLIKAESLRNFTIEGLEKAPKYFWTMPSSTSGKHHPSDEGSIGGQVLHVKRIVVAGIHWCRMWKMSDLAQDEMVVAALLHDICKCGPEDVKDGEIPYTVADHPFYVRPLLEKHSLHTKFFNEKGLLNVYEPIMRAIEAHYGPWTPEDKKELIRSYYNEYQQLAKENAVMKDNHLLMQGLYVADYMSSRNNVFIDVMRNIKEQ